MATSPTPRKRTSTKSKPAAERSSAKKPAAAEATEATRAPAPEKKNAGGRTVTFTVPSFDRVAGGAANAAMLPVAAARQVLPTKGGLPVYLGLGVLGVADIIEWPVAIGLGVGYAFLRRAGILPQPSPSRPASA
ncbi:hypothetical protein [Streptomyces sp. NPDC006368]|uniref:hypothetical protein n=1 Tax=Streptomyces sp. NPDC006368 TaxID=3156760 RepID=UPI0033BF1CCA